MIKQLTYILLSLQTFNCFNTAKCIVALDKKLAKDTKSMIEVEVRFHLPEEKREHFLKNAVFVSVVSFTDTYYDTQDYALSIQDVWLRTRDSKFVLKVPATHANTFTFDKTSPMHEIEDEMEIRKVLGIQAKLDIKQDIESHGYKPLYTFTSTRRKYKKDGFSIDVDHVDYKFFTYDICEVEVMVESENQVQETLQKIHSFIAKHGITVQPIDGKLIYLIKRVNPEHFRILQKTNDSAK